MEGFRLELFSGRELRAMVLAPLVAAALLAAGAAWLHQGNPGVPDVVMIDSATGLAEASRSTWDNPLPTDLYRTRDGGLSWQPLAASGLPACAYGLLVFSDRQRGWLLPVRPS
jgi:hypothetical protein